MARARSQSDWAIISIGLLSSFQVVQSKRAGRTHQLSSDGTVKQIQGDPTSSAVYIYIYIYISVVGLTGNENNRARTNAARRDKRKKL